MSRPSAPAERPAVGLDVEPRLLRDALERALSDDGLTIVDLRDGATCDILLVSGPSESADRAEVVVSVGEDASTESGLLTVANLLDLIHRWESTGHL